MERKEMKNKVMTVSVVLVLGEWCTCWYSRMVGYVWILNVLWDDMCVNQYVSDMRQTNDCSHYHIYVCLHLHVTVSKEEKNGSQHLSSFSELNKSVQSQLPACNNIISSQPLPMFDFRDPSNKLPEQKCVVITRLWKLWKSVGTQCTPLCTFASRLLFVLCVCLFSLSVPLSEVQQHPGVTMPSLPPSHPLSTLPGSSDSRIIFPFLLRLDAGSC